MRYHRSFYLILIFCLRSVIYPSETTGSKRCCTMEMCAKKYAIENGNRLLERLFSSYDK